jgi:hypothetical protein
MSLEVDNIGPIKQLVNAGIYSPTIFPTYNSYMGNVIVIGIEAHASFN